MKIITKKSVIFAALAVVLLVTALVISCNPLDGIEKEEPSKPGTGKVRLTIDSRNTERTIIPAALPSNTKYFVTFTGHAADVPVLGDPALSDYSTTVSGSGTISNIPVGTYSALSVIVYTDASDLSSLSAVQAKAIGSGSYSGGQTLTISGTTLVLTAPIATTLYNPGTNTSVNGTFRYSITLDSSTNRFANATFKIISRAAGTQVGSIVDFKTASNNTTSPTSLSSGYYNVVFSLTDTDSHVVNFYEILQVYQNMESVLSRTISDAIFPAAVTPPTVGSATITINAPNLGQNVTFTVTVSGTGVVLTTPDDTFEVTIPTGNSNASIAVEVTSPSSGVNSFSWHNSDGTSITSTDGISCSESGQIYTISINSVDSNFDLVTIPDNIETQVEALYNSKNFNSPRINIIFQ